MKWYSWFGTVLGYVVQTKCLSIIHSKIMMRSLAKGERDALKGPATGDDPAYILTIYLTFIYCVSLLFMLPVAQFACERIAGMRWHQQQAARESASSNAVSANNDTSTTTLSSSSAVPSAGAGTALTEESLSTTDNSDSSATIEMDLLNAVEAQVPMCTTRQQERIRQEQLRILEDMQEEQAAHVTGIATESGSLPISSSRSDSHGVRTTDGPDSPVAYLSKLAALAVCLVVPLFTYVYALSLSPAFDVSLIQNTSVFEITTLLFGVCGISRKRNLFRNFLVMMTALVGILIVSYTKATCDLLSGKLTINKHTGEVADPFLFDRLKGGLVCGLGSLMLGPFAVLWHHWFGSDVQRGRSTAVVPVEKFVVKHSMHVSLVGTVCLFLLLPFIPKLTRSFDLISSLYMDKFFWVTIMCSILFGTLPNLFAVMAMLHDRTPEFLTTCNLGAIIFMGLTDWILEPGQTTIVQWEVIGYMMLASSCIFLTVTLR